MNNGQPTSIPTWRYTFLPTGLAVALFFIVASLTPSMFLMAIVMAYAITCAILDRREPVLVGWWATINFATGAIFSLLMLLAILVVFDAIVWRSRGPGGVIMQGGIEAFHDVCPAAAQLDWRYLDAKKERVAYRCWDSVTPYPIWPFYRSAESADLGARLKAFLNGPGNGLPPNPGCVLVTKSPKAIGVSHQCVVAMLSERVEILGLDPIVCDDPALRGSPKGVPVPITCVERGFALLRPIPVD